MFNPTDATLITIVIRWERNHLEIGNYFCMFLGIKISGN
jgi:hypothetical protein